MFVKAAAVCYLYIFVPGYVGGIVVPADYKAVEWADIYNVLRDTGQTKVLEGKLNSTFLAQLLDLGVVWGCCEA